MSEDLIRNGYGFDFNHDSEVDPGADVCYVLLLGIAMKNTSIFWMPTLYNLEIGPNKDSGSNLEVCVLIIKHPHFHCSYLSYLC